MRAVMTAAISACITAVGLSPALADPDFSTNGVAWIATSNDLIAVPGGPQPVKDDPAHPYVPNGRNVQPTFRIGDLTNPILKPGAVEAMRKDNDEVLKGKVAFTARSSCRPAGVPGFSSFIVEPIFFIQAAKEVLMVYAGNEETRHIYIGAEHSTNPKPSWYGESVGHYDGDTLVIDTIGLNTKTFVDNYRTPHSEKLHVVERYHLINGGNGLEVNMTIDDPDTFTTSWQATQRYRRVTPGALDEQACAENNGQVADYQIPVADKPDF